MSAVQKTDDNAVEERVIEVIVRVLDKEIHKQLAHGQRKPVQHLKNGSERRSGAVGGVVGVGVGDKTSVAPTSANLASDVCRLAVGENVVQELDHGETHCSEWPLHCVAGKADRLGAEPVRARTWIMRRAKTHARDGFGQTHLSSAPEQSVMSALQSCGIRSANKSVAWRPGISGACGWFEGIDQLIEQVPGSLCT